MFPTPGERARFAKNPAKFITKAIRDYVAYSPNNQYSIFPGEPIWDEPLVGFADGDDPLFQRYKQIIGDFHVTPREVLDKYLRTGGLGERDLSRISVISWVLPVAARTRQSMRKEAPICSVRWNRARFEGQEFIFRLSRYIVALLEGMGLMAVAPELTKWFEMVELSDGKASRWSQRHIAYAAGLGTFGLSDGFITAKGIAIRAGSVVCNLALPASPRPYDSFRANCLFYSRGKCGKCIKRCPAGAISEKGHDKIKCFQCLIGMKEKARQAGVLEDYIGTDIIGCGFCQVGVPCESGIPVK
jgi:epoxyqueuosine reductase